ncbi:MAG: prepilin-type N-terminal cleavage/methylation domain-containing protein [Verrucomicrobiota bacterium]|nr:prepilin-type N-terminal cleavage/methylation domain-containing protein [Verrucomicrobiota bacterium]
MKNFENKSNSPSQGFTLIELAVVAAVMGILAALLVPSLNKAKSRSQTISCLSNLQQLQVCFQMYAEDHNGSLPLNNFIENANSTSLNAGISWCPGNARTDITTANIESGLLFPYNRSVAIYHCPADGSKVETERGKKLPQLRTRSYRMSASINCETLQSVIPSFKKISEITAPSSIFVFLDAQEDDIINSCFALYPDRAGSPRIWLDLPDDRHYQGGNLSFADGHVERWKWLAPKTIKQKLQRPMSMDDLEDMQRLQAAMRK